MKNHDFALATNLPLLKRAGSDNTFATARNLGRVLPTATRISFRASGTVGKSDRVDFYKVTLSPGANLPFGSNTYRLKSGSAILSAYVDVQGSRRFAGKMPLRRGSISLASQAVNPLQIPFTVYFKIESRAREARYNLAFSFFR